MGVGRKKGLNSHLQYYPASPINVWYKHHTNDNLRYKPNIGDASSTLDLLLPPHPQLQTSPLLSTLDHQQTALQATMPCEWWQETTTWSCPDGGLFNLCAKRPFTCKDQLTQVLYQQRAPFFFPSRLAAREVCYRHQQP